MYFCIAANRGQFYLGFSRFRAIFPNIDNASACELFLTESYTQVAYHIFTIGEIRCPHL